MIANYIRVYLLRQSGEIISTNKRDDIGDNNAKY